MVRIHDRNTRQDLHIAFQASGENSEIGTSLCFGLMESNSTFHQSPTRHEKLKTIRA
jgi:hypothetical protein